MSNTEHAFHSTALYAVNQALVTIGHDVALTELSTTSEVVESRKCAYLYEGSRMKVLRDHAWNFARRESAVCTCDVCAERGGTGFPYECPTPSKCVRVLECRAVPGRMHAHWRIFGTTVRSDVPICRIVYTGDVDDLDKWSPDAFRALVLRLAADLAKPITGRVNERQLQESAYREQLESAKLADARETNTPDDVWGENHTVLAMRGALSPRPCIHFMR